MVRRFAEVVHVGLEEIGSSRDGAARPAAFRWRGQRYVVQEVLGHWRERRAWWAGGAEEVLAASADLGQQAQSPALRRSSLVTASVNAVPPQRNWAEQLNGEYEVWRVEARRSHGLVAGVYDLCHDTCASPDLSTWRLLRLVD